MSKIRAAAEEEGHALETPEYLEDMGTEAEAIWLAFSQLSARRSSDQGFPRPISLEAIWCYIDLVLRSWTEDEIEDLLLFLQKLDDFYIAHRARGIEKSQKTKNSKRGRRRRGK